MEGKSIWYSYNYPTVDFVHEIICDVYVPHWTWVRGTVYEHFPFIFTEKEFKRPCKICGAMIKDVITKVEDVKLLSGFLNFLRKSFPEVW